MLPGALAGKLNFNKFQDLFQDFSDLFNDRNTSFFPNILKNKKPLVAPIKSL